MSSVVSEKQGVYEVLSPVSKSAGNTVPLAANIPDLNGKTLCEIRHTFRSDETFPMLEQLLRERYPEVKFVSNKEVPDLPALSRDQIAELGNILRQKGCDALLSGNGA